MTFLPVHEIFCSVPLYCGVAYVLLHVDQYIYIVPSSAVFLVAVSVILRIACAFSAATTGWPSLAMERHGQP
ncbi:MAG: hypothetical protein NXY57DRAFT_623331 [Lentinula lateritia]|nr:MAG: hypothetical protein NXY57DRAFT_623331 [Lentinula lateritia]